MPIVISMIDIIMTNMLIKTIVGPKSAISDHKLAKIVKMPEKGQHFIFVCKNGLV